MILATGNKKRLIYLLIYILFLKESMNVYIKKARYCLRENNNLFYIKNNLFNFLKKGNRSIITHNNKNKNSNNKNSNIENTRIMDFCQVDLDEFCYKQFDKTNKSCSHIPYDKNEFINKVNELIKEKKIKVVGGYASFCKHIFIENFTDATIEAIEINNKNRGLIKTDYISRRDTELPVLIRWISKKDIKENVKAKYLDLILYSREQIEKENKETNHIPKEKSTCLYSIISIKPQNEDYELPMTPITMLRNTLITEGGSGISLDREKYLESVKYWRNHVSIFDN
ncbi:conserved protein, unknown function [Plasmodium yoelii]|uniref:Uncharacterized protein n=3 Tax=Plasmodium yoelii TaxID=5861 RepID=Q7RQ59_PLAYO|nr:conserved protein, unknown function [Plasmodium yoelii]EAA20535.1 hypothetical protein [Plasmodium yoelii yoelii]CDU16114.1 conserved protein, unknown function [Plasmodium yoelii]VTZ71739.1 conserved protein, unknown function [Plasmodium yoelii]|eukprot:XP_728970.1 conserved protein, unknown function [Plasmodium yoelii]